MLFVTHHFMPPTSNTLLRSSRFEISEKFSIFQVNLPYRSVGWRPVDDETWGANASAGGAGFFVVGAMLEKSGRSNEGL